MSEDVEIGVLAESFNTFLLAEWPREKAIAYARSNDSYAADLWIEAAGLGWTALAVPEAYGGLGMGNAATAALHEALGAVAAPLPMLGNLLAGALVERAGTDAQKDALLPGLAEGSTRAAIAHPAAGVLDASGSVLNGVVADILDAPAANTLFLRANRNGSIVWLTLPAQGPGVTIERTQLADTTRSLGTVTLQGVAIDEANVLVPQNSQALEDALLRLAAIALAADCLGGGDAVLATTIEYMKVREQFGRVIGSFQALKHRVADHKTALEASRSLVEHAASLDPNAPDGLLAALSAKQHVTRAVAEIARDCIQLHGGVGFTSEFVPHIYLKRAKLSEALFGARSTILDRIADLLEAA